MAAVITLAGVSNGNGPIIGNSLVTITGTNFVQSPNLKARFGLLSVSATHSSASLVTARTPAHASAVVAVSVTNNDQDYAATAVFYTYNRTLYFVPLPYNLGTYSCACAATYVITGVFPPLGPTAGGTVVTVTGVEFLAVTWCKFGTAASSAATVVSSTVVRCSAPALGAGVAYPELSGNNQDFTTNQVPYMYYGSSLLSVCSFVAV
jgi:hypothetical protein